MKGRQELIWCTQGTDSQSVVGAGRGWVGAKFDRWAGANHKEPQTSSYKLGYLF